MGKETCEDCVHFDVRDHKMFCRHFDASMSSNYKGCCKYFKNKKQIVTTRNPYIKPFTVSASALDGLRPTVTCIDDVVNYCKADVAALTQWFGNNRKEYHKMFNINKNKVKKVIFNPPATIVLWKDGTKTVVKAQNGDIFDREKGFAMACAKKFFGNQGNYYDVFRKHDAIGRHDGEKIGKIIRSGIEDGVYMARVDLTCDGLVPETYVKIPALDVEPVGRTKSDYIIEKIKEFTRDFWMLKVYSELDTEKWVLDIGVMNSDMGKSMRFIIYLEDVEWERIDESIGRVTSNIANELIPSVWEPWEKLVCEDAEYKPIEIKYRPKERE